MAWLASLHWLLQVRDMYLLAYALDAHDMAFASQMYRIKLVGRSVLVLNV